MTEIEIEATIDEELQLVDIQFEFDENGHLLCKKQNAVDVSIDSNGHVIGGLV